MKRLIKAAVEIDNMTRVPPMIQQKGPDGYDSFQDFIDKATDEEIENYKGQMDQETLRQMEQEKFQDERHW